MSEDQGDYFARIGRSLSTKPLGCGDSPKVNPDSPGYLLTLQEKLLNEIEQLGEELRSRLNFILKQETPQPPTKGTEVNRTPWGSSLSQALALNNEKIKALMQFYRELLGRIDL